MSAARLFLIRHAQTVPDPARPARTWPLADGAQEACLTLANRLRGTGLARIVSSEEPKAEATARLVADALGLPWHSAPDLHEHERTGVPFMDEATWLETLRAFFARPHDLVFGTETAAQALGRFDRALGRVLADHSGETLAICSHATVMTLFVTRHTPSDSFAFWQSLRMPDLLELTRPAFVLGPKVMSQRSAKP